MRRGSLLFTSEMVNIIICDGQQFPVITDTYLF